MDWKWLLVFTLFGLYEAGCAAEQERDANNVSPRVDKQPSHPPVVRPSPPIRKPPARPKPKPNCNNVTRHEVPACTWGCPPERTCQNRKWPPPPCAPPQFPCTPKCICDQGYARNKPDGICVTLDQCDKCPDENEYFACDGKYSENCVGHCYCFPNHVRNNNGTCVYVDPASPPEVLEPTTEPSEPQVTCNNATLHEVPGCTWGCPPERTCENRHWPPFPCAPPDFPCTPKCLCADGYIRNKPDGTCITEEQCEPQVTCNNGTLHEVPGCTWGCPPERTCQNRNWPPPPCARPDFPCTPKCLCDDGYTRNQPDGTCITEEQCDTCPGENEYFACDGKYSEDCVGHCYCLSNHVRDINGNCVYVDPASPPEVLEPPIEPQEPLLICNKETLHEVRACNWGCPPELTCQNRNSPPYPCAHPPPFPCRQKCECEGGYARNQPGGTCITLEQCEKCPGENEYFACDCECFYSEDCVGHCHCFSDHVRDINGTCVYVEPASPPGILVPPSEP